MKEKTLPKSKDTLSLTVAAPWLYSSPSLTLWAHWQPRRNILVNSWLACSSWRKCFTTLVAFRALAHITVFTLKYTFVFTIFKKKMLKQNIDTIYYNLLRVETDPARITTSSPPPTTARPTASLPAPALIYDVCYQECVYFYFIKF